MLLRKPSGLAGDGLHRDRDRRRPIARHTRDGRAYDYDRLLLATGAKPRQITIAGAELDGVHSLRTLQDCDALRARLETGGRVVVVGAGWIGSEFAASARQRGLEVTIVDPHALPNERIFGAEIGAFYRDVHRDHGVELVLGEGVQAFDGDGAVARVRTTNGRKIECDFVVVGIGVVPRVELASRAGLDVDNGILVDENFRVGAGGVRRRRCRGRAAPSSRTGFGSNTGRTRCTKVRSRRARCSASR